jgi:hypothetical protein
MLLLASESGDSNEIFNAVEGIVSGCLDGADISKLPYSDIEYLFLQIRSKSVGEIAEFTITCDCEHKTKNRVSLDLSKVTLDDKKLNYTIQLSDRVFLKMQLPTFGVVKRYYGMKYDDLEELMIVSCIKEIMIDDQVFDASQQTIDELRGFVGSIPPEPREKLDEFFDSIPTLRHSLKYKCDGCNCDREVIVEGLENFFV